MTIELNHTIVPAHDPKASARFLADILGLPVDPPVARFTPVTLGNRACLDYLHQETFEPHHYAFLMSDAEFDAAFARIVAAGVTYFGDPACQQVGQIYQKRGSRHLLPRPRRPSDGDPDPGRLSGGAALAACSIRLVVASPGW